MPASKKPAEKRVVRDEPKKDAPVVNPVTQEPAQPERVADLVAPVKSDAVTFAKNVLTVDLTALETLTQGERQVAVKTARTVLDKASQ